MTPGSTEISRADARRIALAAQGFGRPRPAGAITSRHLRRVFDDVGAVQIDAVDVLVRSHYLPFFSRLGRYNRALLDRLTGPKGDIVEYWVHAACLLPTTTWPLLAWKMRDEHYWASVRKMADEHPEVLDGLLAEVGARKEVAAGDLEQRDRPKEPWWDWSRTKLLLEYLFWTGRVTAGRRPNFERTYALAATRLRPEELATRDAIATDDAKHASLLLAARALGIGTARDIGEYVGLNQTLARPFLNAMVRDGELIAATVEGLKAPAYLHRTASTPRQIDACALVSPFDSLVWQRDRVEELFGFRYRIEIYVPKPKRVHGYYVLPFLLGERFAARVDLKADRASGHLLVQASYLEPGEDADEVAPSLITELRDMARWLGLDEVVIQPAGDLAPHLAEPERVRPEHVFHFSEDPDIRVFAPHQAKTAQVMGEWVWAVDEYRAPCYWFPRDCPRGTFWPSPGAKLGYAAEALLAGASRVHAVDWRWMDAMLDCDLYVYTFDAETFRPTEDAFGAEGAGFWVSEETLTPIDLQRVGPLLHRHAEARIELRAVHDLAALWQRVITTPGLAFSGIRLRNLDA